MRNPGAIFHLIGKAVLKHFARNITRLPVKSTKSLILQARSAFLDLPYFSGRVWTFRAEF